MPRAWLLRGSPPGSRALFLAAALFASVAALAGEARAFALLHDDARIPLEEVLARAPRWSAEPGAEIGLADGIQVRVHPRVEEDLGATSPDEVQIVRLAIEEAFRAWENEALRFEIEFESDGTEDGPAFGGEIDVFTRSALDFPFSDHPPTVFGVGSSEHVFLEQRLLTNGRRADGFVIMGGEVDLNATLLRQTQEDLGIGIGLASLALVRLVMHEVGHTLGFGHPNEVRNFDTDLDPTNGAVVDPLDPFAGIQDSPNFLQGAIMSNEPCGVPFAELDSLCSALFFRTLTGDDRVGRDVLYPVPEPEATWAALAALIPLALRARRLRTRRRRHVALPVDCAARVAPERPEARRGFRRGARSAPLQSEPRRLSKRARKSPNFFSARSQPRAALEPLNGSEFEWLRIEASPRVPAGPRWVPTCPTAPTRGSRPPTDLQPGIPRGLSLTEGFPEVEGTLLRTRSARPDLEKAAPAARSQADTARKSPATALEDGPFE